MYGKEWKGYQTQKEKFKENVFSKEWWKYKMHNIDWCEGGLKLAYIATNNVGKYDLTPRMKYIMVRIDNWDITLVQEVWNIAG